jgi:hypothetical protein
MDIDGEYRRLVSAELNARNAAGASIMFANESSRTWSAVGLLGGAAVLCFVASTANGQAYDTWRETALTVLLIGVMWLVSPGPRPSLKRSLREIHADIASGRQRRSTPLQLTCGLLALVLMILQIYRQLHRY